MCLIYAPLQSWFASHTATLYDIYTFTPTVSSNCLLQRPPPTTSANDLLQRPPPTTSSNDLLVLRIKGLYQFTITADPSTPYTYALQLGNHISFLFK